MKTDWKVFVMSVLFASTCAAASAVLAEGLEDVDAAWVRAVKAGSLEHVVDLYAPDATLYAPDLMEAKGTEAIRKLYAEMLGSMTIKDFVFLEQNYTTKGNFSVGWGRFLLTGEPKAGGAPVKPVKMEGRFTSVAERKGGKWRYIVVHASLPLPAPPKAPAAGAPPKP